MRSIIIFVALLLAMASSTALGLTLNGSNDNATAWIFGSSRMPVDDENSTQEILQVDVGLLGADNANYELVDQNDLVYPAGQILPLSSGRQSVYFLAEMDSLFKLINVTPEGSDPIYINWWKTPNASNDRLKVRYYGILDSSINSTMQETVVQVTVENIGSDSIYVTPHNFSLLDQWGWSYEPVEANFESETVEPASYAPGRLLLAFYGLPPAVRPAALAYDYGTSDQLVIMFERDFVPLSDEAVYGTASESNAADNVTSSATVAPVAAASAAQMVDQAASADQAPANESAIKLSSLEQKLAASKARLDAKMKNLDDMTPEENDTAVSTAALNNSTSTSA